MNIAQYNTFIIDKLCFILSTYEQIMLGLKNWLKFKLWKCNDEISNKIFLSKQDFLTQVSLNMQTSKTWTPSTNMILFVEFFFITP